MKKKKGLVFNASVNLTQFDSDMDHMERRLKRIKKLAKRVRKEMRK